MSSVSVDLHGADPEIDQSHVAELLDAYFDSNKLAKSQIESFENFLNLSIPQIIEEVDTVASYVDEHSISHHFRFHSPEKRLPQDEHGLMMYPSQARYRDLTYSAILTIKVDHSIRGPSGETISEPVTYGPFALCRVPVMVRAPSGCHLGSLRSMDLPSVGECPLDQGGYFVVNGSEKVLVAQERQAHNKIYCFQQREGVKWLYTCELRSVPETTFRSTGSSLAYQDAPASHRNPQSERGGATNAQSAAIIPPKAPVFTPWTGTVLRVKTVEMGHQRLFLH
jgi:DNA-directed RNA polymerase II subunit RPB2